MNLNYNPWKIKFSSSSSLSMSLSVCVSSLCLCLSVGLSVGLSLPLSLNTCINPRLLHHVFFVLVNTGSTYTVLTGYVGSEFAAPGAPSSFLSLSSGTLCGLAEAARAEHVVSRVAVNEVHLKCLVHRKASLTWHIFVRVYYTLLVVIIICIMFVKLRKCWRML